MSSNGKAVILIVDDKPGNLYSLEGLLAAEDRTILTSLSGREALQLSLKEAVDLIILDVQMPEVDGFEVAQILKSNKRTKDIPIIFATAESKDYKFLIQGYDEGAVDYMFKPLDPYVVRSKVSVLLRMQLQKRELIEKNIMLQNAEKQIRELNQGLTISLRQLEATNNELEAFSYTVSHDLRAPLRGLNGYSRMLEEDYGNVLDAEGKRLLGNIQRNATKMGMLIDDLLEFSRLGRKQIRTVPVNMEALVKEIVADVLQDQQSKAEVVIEKLPDAPADLSLIRQVWVNLISNAVKYSRKKEQPRVDIGFSIANDEVTYFVKDNGAGFSMKYADKLFGVFQRLHSPSDFEGTGIGLATVHRIITKHGGKVWADAKEKEGATFFFTLPLSVKDGNSHDDPL